MGRNRMANSRKSRSPAMRNVWDMETSLPMSLEDFESPGCNPEGYSSRSPERPRPSLAASALTDRTDDESQQNSWSPPAWRKAGTGWFSHQDASLIPSNRLRSPVRIAKRDEDEDESSVAAEIPLPRSPTKGRSVSPERLSSAPPQPQALRPPDSFLGPPENKSCKSKPAGMSMSCSHTASHSVLRPSGRPTTYTANRGYCAFHPPILLTMHQISPLHNHRASHCDFQSLYLPSFATRARRQTRSRSYQGGWTRQVSRAPHVL